MSEFTKDSLLRELKNNNQNLRGFATSPMSARRPNGLPRR